jgi:phage gp45-like
VYRQDWEETGKMAENSSQKHLTNQEPLIQGITKGTVVDTADPMQMGRLRIQCPALGDRDDVAISNLPWAEYVSPFGGNVQVGVRGADEDDVSGPTAYGMWAIPKLGAQVLVMCLDGKPDHRVWLGCVYNTHMAHTMPHGRYSQNEDIIDEDEDDQPNVTGPFDSFENSIQPLHKNQKEAFREPLTGDINFEFLTRAADYQVSVVKENNVSRTSISRAADDLTQGYRTNLLAPDDIIIETSTDQDSDKELTTKPNLDNMVTSIVSPGFHAFSMDDRPENSRIRFRTAAGHQIILDDTNERIYISTAKGKNWIEIDQAGNIDIHTDGKLSAHATKDVNFSTEGSFRVDAQKGIHLNSGKEIRLHSDETTHIDSDAEIRVTSAETTHIDAGDEIRTESANDTHILAGGSIRFNAAVDVLGEAGGVFGVNAGTTLELGSQDNLLLKSGADIRLDPGLDVTFDVSGKDTTVNDLIDFLDEFVGEVDDFRQAFNAHTHGGSGPPNPGNGSPVPAPTEIDSSGPGSHAPPPDDATQAALEAEVAYKANRRPFHEPWSRTDSDDNGVIFLNYEDPLVGKKFTSTNEDGTTTLEETVERGENWRR